MTHRKIVSIVLLFLAAPLIAQKVATGMRHIKKPEQNGSVTVAFDPTPVGSTETLTCGYNCFYQLNADACDYSGMITLRGPREVVYVRFVSAKDPADGVKRRYPTPPVRLFGHRSGRGRCAPLDRCRTRRARRSSLR